MRRWDENGLRAWEYRLKSLEALMNKRHALARRVWPDETVTSGDNPRERFFQETLFNKGLQAEDDTLIWGQAYTIAMKIFEETEMTRFTQGWGCVMGTMMMGIGQDYEQTPDGTTEHNMNDEEQFI